MKLLTRLDAGAVVGGAGVGASMADQLRADGGVVLPPIGVLPPVGTIPVPPDDVLTDSDSPVIGSHPLPVGHGPLPSGRFGLPNTPAELNG